MNKRRGVVIHPQELDENWIHWMEEGGINVLGLHPVGGQSADQSLRDMIEDEFLPEKQALYQLAHSKGIQREYEMHALSHLLPRRLFSGHPEWFRMNDQGNRVPDFNFCPG